MKTFWIALGGLVGVFARYYGGLAAARFLPPTFPYGTFLINLFGAFLIGVVYVAGLERQAIPEAIRVGLMVGFLGGFTTFSSYCLESARLLETGQYLAAALYYILSPLLGLVCVGIGLLVTRYFLL